ncbi:replication initiator [Micromonospora sp. KC207]|uniref:replication initiator n=1 Tax=Micromonospora sp. KC207 TaxID=2530377 RepID=UPI0026CD1025
MSSASGAQVDARGVMPGTGDAERTIRYVTKYITKNTGDCHRRPPTGNGHTSTGSGSNSGSPRAPTGAPTGCSTRPPKKAHAKLKPGRCKGKVHQRDTLGIGGRRTLIRWLGELEQDAA